MTTHPACGKSWVSKQAQHCDVCHVTFSGTSWGDAHRVGSFGHPARVARTDERTGVTYPARGEIRYRRRCVPEWALPALGMLRSSTGIWGGPERDTTALVKRRMDARRASQAPALPGVPDDEEEAA